MLAKEDWNKDTENDTYLMNKERFLQSLFQLADIWTDTLIASHYVRCGVASVALSFGFPIILL